ncbi:MAG: response regulator transcription factor [Sphingobacteriales bacterium]|nr:MAG: response regulator transcription factor [Sphingobacteriales bacterium]
MKVLLVEDEPGVASFITRSLDEEGFEISLAPDGQFGLSMAKQYSFELIILDIMLPGINGLEVCKQVRAAGIETPVLMLTALGTTENIVTGLDAGADDYLVKPFKLAELLARIRSLTRRKKTSEPVATAATLSIADLSLDTDRKTATRSGKQIELTATEYRLLEYLIKNKKRVLSRMDILEQVWGVDFNMNTKVVDVYINYLRKKIDKDFEPKLLHTSVGMGYIMKEGE